MRTLIKISLLTGVGAIGWWIGGRLSTDAAALALGVIFGVMGGIPIALAALASTRNQRVDHYHHHEHKAIAETQEKPAARITTQPQRYIVVNEAKRLQATERQQIEVKR
ncbi:MAG: AtpZ/AtpI family protein [Desulfurellales bacterium]|nr:MAG: AtpZ/AtpI family protein [Desulfurellales bacterium]